MSKLYKLLPGSIRNRFYSAVSKKVKEMEDRSEKKFEEAIQKIELKPEHIRDLKILTDKPALLNVLPKNAIAAEIGVSRGDYSEKILSVTQPKNTFN